MEPAPTPPDRTFHVVMGGLLVASLILDQQTRGSELWNPPGVSIITLVLGLVWVGRFAWLSSLQHKQRERVLTDRIERLERKMQQLEDAPPRNQPPAFDPGRPAEDPRLGS